MTGAYRLRCWCILAAIILFTAGSAVAGEPAEETKKKSFRVPFFDGIKLQSTNIYPKLTNANHAIHEINTWTGTSLRDWDSIWVQSLDIVLWKDLSRYFKMDVAVAGSTGSLLSSSAAFKGTAFDTDVRMRQRYSALAFWTNIYFYPLTTNYKDVYSSGRVFEPFVGAGLGYTFFRSEAVFKFRKQNRLYNRVRSNWNGDEWAYKMLAGFNVNLGAISPSYNGWIITCTAFQVWNRLKGHAKVHGTDGLKVYNRPVPMDITMRRNIDIDLTGQYYSIAIGRYF